MVAQHDIIVIRCIVACRTLVLDVLQLSGLLAGDVKESPNGNPTRDLQMAANRTRPHTLCGPGKLDGWQEMIFFFRFSSSTAFSIWQPKNARQTLGDKLVCILNLQHYPSIRSHVHLVFRTAGS